MTATIYTSAPVPPEPAPPPIQMRDRDLLFVDVETTGLDETYHEIIEIAAIRLNSDMVEIGRVERKIIPMQIERADPQALEVNRYTKEGWLSAEHIGTAMEDFTDLVTGKDIVLVGHNPQFDVKFIRASIRQLINLGYASGLRCQKKIEEARFKYQIDTSSLAWPLVQSGFLENLKLITLCERFGISNEGAHRAMADVERAIKVYKALMRCYASVDLLY